MTWDDIKDILPPNYVSKPNTVILINESGCLILKDNGDGTLSGLDAIQFNDSDKKDKQIITSPYKYKWPN